MTKKIITLSGKQFCGKDTVAKILLSKLPSFVRVGLADAIKLEYSRRTGLSVEEIEANKSLYRPDLIALGNEGRNIDKDYWLKSILKLDHDVIVPDVRLPHEIEVFKEHGAFCIRVEASSVARSKRGVLTKEDDYTEIALDNYKNWNYVLSNDSDYNFLVLNSKDLLSAINIFFMTNF